MTYCATKSSRSSQYLLAHRGSNGGIAGSDASVIETHPDSKVDIRSIDNHQESAITLITAVEINTTTTGEVVAIMHQHACHGKNKTTHSSPQIEHHKNIVDDLSVKAGGGQHVTTLDKYKVPMPIRGALP